MQVFQETGGIVVPSEKLRNMRIGVDPEDKRRVEFAVYNLKFGHLCFVMSHKCRPSTKTEIRIRNAQLRQA